MDGIEEPTELKREAKTNIELNCFKLTSSNYPSNWNYKSSETLQMPNLDDMIWWLTIIEMMTTQLLSIKTWQVQRPEELQEDKNLISWQAQSPDWLSQ